MLKIAVTGTAFARDLDDVGRRQLPFAMALALTRTAEEAVRESVKDLPSRFIIRNQWVAKGYRVQRATKSNLVAMIQHKDPYMYLQEVGGKKRPLAAKSVAVPKAARPTPQSTTPRSKWPGRINRKFTVTTGDTALLYARTGRRKGRHVKHAAKGMGRQRGPGYRDPALKLMYVMKRSVTVKPRLKLRETTQRVVQQRFATNLNGFLAYAMRTAR